ncbi:calcium-binding protein [Chlorogloeopsis sp. ULAP01]|uniref:calcium-binding protein n=1 Tax=Chlorogloeopsis sp. ULAP01 TaxID=3056483 RepID=UPI0025AAA1A8|nr:calcium-binding protein [Chlorogloeopsis sp. ULAP01]MDM9383483.1 calcium-binding protein [Chlorogloeopsis sp. ULAP01]
MNTTINHLQHCCIVIEMSPEYDCLHDMFVEVRYQEGSVDNIFSARLFEVNPIDVDEATAQAIADWHYWVGRGYELIHY